MTKAIKSAKPRKLPDPRHAELRIVLAKYWAVENPSIPDLPWGPADAGSLGTFLQMCPQLTVEQITALLRNRLRSDDHAPGEPVFVWIKYLTRYLAGPLDKYRQLKGASNGSGSGKPNRADAGTGHAAGATNAALERIRGVARD